MIALLPALVLACLAFFSPHSAYQFGFAVASVFTAVMAIVSMLLLRLTSSHGVQGVLLGVVSGMLFRLVALVVFCFAVRLFPEVHLITACLAAVAGLVAALIIDSASIARRLCPSKSEPVPEVARV